MPARKSIKNIFRACVPPLIWSLSKKMLGREEWTPMNYQGVILPFRMERMLKSEFSDTFEKYASLDFHMASNGGDIFRTRLRVYNLYSFAQMSLSNSRMGGDVLFAGISYGTAPLVLLDLCAQGLIDRSIYLVDPFTGAENHKDSSQNRNYNTDPDLVLGRVNNSINCTLIKDFLTPNVVSNFKNLAFVHLNTSDFEAELAAIPILYEKLVSGGILVMDLYGFQNESSRLQIDRLIDDIGAGSFQLVTRQLVIFK